MQLRAEADGDVDGSHLFFLELTDSFQPPFLVLISVSYHFLIIFNA